MSMMHGIVLSKAGIGILPVRGGMIQLWTGTSIQTRIDILSVLNTYMIH